MPYKFLLQLLMVTYVINSMDLPNEIIVDISHRLYTDRVESLSIPDNTKETGILVLTHSCIINHYNKKSGFNSLKIVNKAIYDLLQKAADKWQTELVKELLGITVDQMLFFNYAKSNSLFNDNDRKDNELYYHINTDTINPPIDNRTSLSRLEVQEKLNSDIYLKPMDEGLILTIGTTFETLKNVSSSLEKDLLKTDNSLEKFNLVRLAFLEKSTLNYFLNSVAPYPTNFTFLSLDYSYLFYAKRLAYYEFYLKIKNIPLTLFYEMCIKKIKDNRSNAQNKS